MITVKVAELLKLAKDLAAEGYEYVEIDELPAEDDMPLRLTFSAYEDDGGMVDFDELEHVDV